MRAANNNFLKKFNSSHKNTKYNFIKIKTIKIGSNLIFLFLMRFKKKIGKKLIYISKL